MATQHSPSHFQGRMRMTAFCSSSCCWSPLLSPPTSRQTRVVRLSSKCSYDAPPCPKDTIVVASAPQSPKSLSSSMVASIAACLVFTASCAPAEAGLLSGSPGLESFQLPSLPTIENLKKIQEDNKARYEELDTKFKSSSYVQELLKRSKENAEKHNRKIQNKYCQRGADWGIGDCAVSGMSEDQRSNFDKALKGTEAPQ
ncbi:hypothetical protein GOP47_0028828 [Adiantum capillus-veneris]|nr:hypothetical protein GOP47_0028828 [Adiantum capillus-veneris]